MDKKVHNFVNLWPTSPRIPLFLRLSEGVFRGYEKYFFLQKKWVEVDNDMVDNMEIDKVPDMEVDMLADNHRYSIGTSERIVIF